MADPGFLEGLIAALESRDPNLAPLPAAYQGKTKAESQKKLRDAARKIAAAQDLPEWQAAVGDATSALDRTDIDVEEILIRLLQLHLPRLAAMFVIAGVIYWDERRAATSLTGGLAIDYARLVSVITNPKGSVLKDLDDEWTKEKKGLQIVARFSHALFSPRTAWGHADIVKQDGTRLKGGRKSRSPRAPTARDAEVEAFRAKSAGWYTVTLPLPPTTLGEDAAAAWADLLGSAVTGESKNAVTLAVRVAEQGGEGWLAAAGAAGLADVLSVPLTESWVLSLGTSAAFGIGYYGGKLRFAVGPVDAAGTSAADKVVPPVVVKLGLRLGGAAPLGAGAVRFDVADTFEIWLRLAANAPHWEFGYRLAGSAVVLVPTFLEAFGAGTKQASKPVRVPLNLDLWWSEGNKDGLPRFSADGRRARSPGVAPAVPTSKDPKKAAKESKPASAKGRGTSSPIGLGAEIPIERKFEAPGAALTIHSLTLALPMKGTQQAFSIRAEARLRVSVRLGPVVAGVDGAGAWVGWWQDRGPADPHLPIGLLPPQGASLLLDSETVKGGGWVRRRQIRTAAGKLTERYEGALQLKVAEFSVHAYGLLEKPAGGVVSLAFVLGVRYKPGVPVGFGVSVIGVGGVVAVHRTFSVDAMRERLKTGAAGSAFFSDNPVLEGSKLLGDLGAILPAKQDAHVFGLTFRLDWASVVRFDVGVLIEVGPGPTLSKIVLLGVARAVITSFWGPPLLNLRLDLVGLVDFDKQVVAIDAVLVNSSIFGTIKITGGAALRASWGEKPHFFLSVGGFHPEFKPEPAVMPQLERVALTQGSEKSSGLYLRIEAYLAITTNSLQFGGKAQLQVAAGPLKAGGIVALDVLFQFVPFQFKLGLSVAVYVKWGDFTLAEVMLEGRISGPGPVVFAGRVRIVILMIPIEWRGSFSIGPKNARTATQAKSLIEALAPELSRAGNLEAVGGDDPHVALALPEGRGDTALVTPLGALAWSQRRSPIGITVDRFEGTPLRGRQGVDLKGGKVQAETRDWFAPSAFCDMTQSEALNRPSFERLQAGAVFGFGARQGGAEKVTVRVQTKLIGVDAAVRTDSRRRRTALTPGSLAAVAGRRAAPGPERVAPLVSATEEAWVVARVGDVVAAPSATAAHQRAAESGGVARPSKDTVQVVA